MPLPPFLPRCFLVHFKDIERLRLFVEPPHRAVGPFSFSPRQPVEVGIVAEAGAFAGDFAFGERLVETAAERGVGGGGASLR
jgi:hypothetical protein